MLRQKKVRVYFGLKGFIDITSISKKAMFSLEVDTDVASRDRPMKPANSLMCSNRGHNNFIEKWDKCRHQNKKLVFYNAIKSSFGLELCNYHEGKLVAKWRMSAHKLNC
jgi:hypothetical protein